jgi:hypothetical protein
MPGSRPPFRDLPKAHFLWGRYAEVPHPLTEVVQAMQALPPTALDVRRLVRAPIVVHEVRAVVFGRRFLVRGIRDPEGRWVEVWAVAPL